MVAGTIAIWPKLSLVSNLHCGAHPFFFVLSSVCRFGVVNIPPAGGDAWGCIAHLLNLCVNGGLSAAESIITSTLITQVYPQHFFVHFLITFCCR